MNVISFSNRDLAGIENPHDDVVVSITIEKHDVKKILVDSRSSINVLFYDTFVWIDLPLSQLGQVSTPLVSFSSDLVKVETKITLPVLVGTLPQLSTIYITFTVVWIPYVYNVILEQPGLNWLDVVFSTKHLLIHFLIKNDIGEIWGDQQMTSTISWCLLRHQSLLKYL